jgi:hypothetical protein
MLARTLESIESGHRPAEAWELVVVDNNSTDDTRQVIERFADRLPIRYEFESTPGLSNARNRALSVAAGRFILWTDDDVLVSPNWLMSYLKGFCQWPDSPVFGGPIEPLFEGVPPRWLQEELTISEPLQAMFVVRSTDLPASFRHGEAGNYPYGANMAMRTQLVREIGFDPTLGRREDLLIHGEETIVIDQLLKHGQGHFLAKASVRHFIPRERQTLGFVRNHARGTGATAVASGGVDGSGRGVGGLPFWLLKQWLTSRLRGVILRMLGRRGWTKEFVSAHADQQAVRLLRQLRASQGL